MMAAKRSVRQSQPGYLNRVEPIAPAVVDLGPEAEALVHAGRAAFRSNERDRARILAMLRGVMGGSIDNDEGDLGERALANGTPGRVLPFVRCRRQRS
jgi:hypothetical protein